MPKRGAVALVTTVLAVLLLFAFKPADQSAAGGLPTAAAVGAPGRTTAPVAVNQPQPTAQPQATRRPASGGGSVNNAPAPTVAPTNPPAAGGNGATGTFTGSAINTAYGTVQIALVVQNGRITDVQLLQMPSDRQLSAQISREAGPMLVQQVLSAQSVNIMGVSGASYTSYGFYESLQSALAQMP